MILLKVICALLILYATRAGCNVVIEIDLADYDPANETGNFFKKMEYFTNNDTRIVLLNLNPSVGYYVIQTHSYKYNLTLVSTVSGAEATGLNVGLIDKLSFNRSATYLLGKSTPSEVLFMIVVVLYENEDPIPGCDQRLDKPVYIPYQTVINKDEEILVSYEPPSIPGTGCSSDGIVVQMFHLYLEQMTSDRSTEYFKSISNFLDARNIKKYGALVPRVGVEMRNQNQWLFNSYQGTGEIFAVVIEYKNRTSAYVPAVSYGCDLVNGTYVLGPSMEHWKILFPFFILLGLFLCFFGHRFFCTSIFLSGFVASLGVTHVILVVFYNFTASETATASFIIGFIFAIVWVFIWCRYGKPYLSISLTLNLAGFLFASLVFNYSGLADLDLFDDDTTYWSTFVSLMVLSLILWTILPLQGHIFCTSLLGSYAFIFALNYYFGGHLQFIVLNVYRRMTVPDFKYALLSPPFQIYDYASVTVWIVIFLCGCRRQWICQRGRSPFPPARLRYSHSNILFTEETPLLGGSYHTYPQHTNGFSSRERLLHSAWGNDSEERPNFLRRWSVRILEILN